MDDDLGGLIILAFLGCILVSAVSIPVAWYYTTKIENQTRVDIVRANLNCPGPKAEKAP